MVGVYAVVADLSIAEAIGGGVVLSVALIGAFFWGSGLGWRDEPRKDRRNGL